MSSLDLTRFPPFDFLLGCYDSSCVASPFERLFYLSTCLTVPVFSWNFNAVRVMGCIQLVDSPLFRMGVVMTEGLLGLLHACGESDDPTPGGMVSQALLLSQSSFLESTLAYPSDRDSTYGFLWFVPSLQVFFWAGCTFSIWEQLMNKNVLPFTLSSFVPFCIICLYFVYTPCGRH